MMLDFTGESEHEVVQAREGCATYFTGPWNILDVVSVSDVVSTAINQASVDVITVSNVKCE